MLRTALMTLALASTASASLLIRTPMVMTHDSATGYLKGNFIKNVVYNWAATQNVGFYEQLSCGARALDLRPQLQKDGSLIMHHGAIAVDTPLKSALGDVTRFLGENPDELVVLISSHCQNDGCNEAANALASSMGIHVITDCQQLASLTYADAKAQSRLPTGGSLLFVQSCAQDNYDDSISCYNKKSTAEGFGPSCYGWSSYHDGAFQRMYDYLNRTSAPSNMPGNRFSQLQALWQEDAAGVAEGTLLGSSLIKDEEKSDLNNELLKRIQEGWFPFINLLEVNNVCNHGKDLQNALRARGGY